MILVAKELLEKNPYPDENAIRHALDGNLCRCTGYVKQIEAVKLASEMMKNSLQDKV
jgi:carbon-monoxide dehydrogenase small subunit